MSDVLHQTSEADLHRFVDGESGHLECDAVRQWLSTHDEDAARVDAWRLQRQLLHARFDGVVRETLPAALSLRASSATRFAITPQTTLPAARAEPPLLANLAPHDADAGAGHRQLTAFILGFCAALLLVSILVLMHKP